MISSRSASVMIVSGLILILSAELSADEGESLSPDQPAISDDPLFSVVVPERPAAGVDATSRTFRDADAGRALISELLAPAADDTRELPSASLEEVEAAAELAWLAGRSSDVVCGTITRVTVETGSLDGTDFPLSVIMVEPSDLPGESEDPGTVELAFWGNREDGQGDFTSSTPQAAVGDRICALVKRLEERLWLTGKNSYFKVQEGKVGLGAVKAEPDIFERVLNTRIDRTTEAN